MAEEPELNTSTHSRSVSAPSRSYMTSEMTTCATARCGKKKKAQKNARAALFMRLAPLEVLGKKKVLALSFFLYSVFIRSLERYRFFMSKWSGDWLLTSNGARPRAEPSARFPEKLRRSFFRDGRHLRK